MNTLSWLVKTHGQLLKQGHRSLVALKGDVSWAEQIYLSFVGELSDEMSACQSVIFSESTSVKGQINRKTYTHHLGTENDAIFFVDSSLNVDALAALSGTLKKGGLLFIWLDLSDHALNETIFVQRLIDNINRSPLNFLLNQAQASFPKLATESNSQPLAASPLDEQTLLVTHICKAIMGKNSAPLVLTADRGRGKSTALAIAAAQLLANLERAVNIVITAPSRLSLNVFYSHLDGLIGQGAKINVCDGYYAIGQNTLRFLPVDQALKSDLKQHILFVDEAAGIPVYLLTKLLGHSKQCVFSSTVYGYEGAGKGFTLKFLPWLKEHYPKRQHLHLKHPIRWSDDDPLEQLLFDTCLLNVELSELTLEKTVLLNGSSQQVRHVSQRELSEDENLLREVFSILVTAHYQTKPSDLKILLDNPNVHVFVAQQEQTVCAVALTMGEGNIEPELVDAVKRGERRLKNQFLPQSILTQCQHLTAFEYSYLRVMRIAVHPLLQNKGIGSYLLTEIERWAIQQNIDCFGTSFAASVSVCSFWFKANLKPARIGFSTDASSGEHSILMLKPLNDVATAFIDELEVDFYNSFDYLLTDDYSLLPVDLVQFILRYNPNQSKVNAFTERDLDNLNAFAAGHTQYSYVVLSLHRWLLYYLSNRNEQDDALDAFIAKVLMKRSVQDLCTEFSFTGKKAFNQYLIQTVKSRLHQA